MSTITPEELNLLIEQTYKVEGEFNELKASYEHLRDTVEKVVEFLPNAIWIIDKDGGIFLQNSQARRLWELLKLLEYKKDEYEIKFNSKSYLVKSSTYKDKVMLSATDITEQKRKENLATMGQMAAHLSHEIRNPIGSISILASTLLNRVDMKNKLMVMEIKKAIHRVERIIKSTLLFTKGVQANKKVISLKELQEEIENSFDFYSFTKEVELDMEFDEDEIYGDFELLGIVFQNFLYNAFDAIEESGDDRGVVTVTHQKNNGYDIFIVKDTGVPIKNKNILYEPFKTTKLKGHGLGLTLSLEIIKAHNGFVEFLEKEKGFRIYLETFK